MEKPASKWGRRNSILHTLVVVNSNKIAFFISCKLNSWRCRMVDRGARARLQSQTNKYELGGVSFAEEEGANVVQRHPAPVWCLSSSSVWQTGCLFQQEAGKAQRPEATWVYLWLGGCWFDSTKRLHPCGLLSKAFNPLDPPEGCTAAAHCPLVKCRKSIDIYDTTVFVSFFSWKLDILRIKYEEMFIYLYWWWPLPPTIKRPKGLTDAADIRVIACHSFMAFLLFYKINW